MEKRQNKAQYTQKRAIARSVIEQYCHDAIVERVPLDEASLSRLLRQAQATSFAVLTAFRGDKSLKTNRGMNKFLIRGLNAAQMGAHRLLGYWDESLAPEAIRQSDAEAGDDPEVEESLFVAKPDDMTDEKFVKLLYKIGRQYIQTAIVYGKGAKWHDIGDRGGKPGEIYLLYPEDGTREKIGTGVSLNKIARAYSRAMSKPDIPFVFESVLRPTNIAGRQGWQRQGLRWLED
jgi:hypothetical protein